MNLFIISILAFIATYIGGLFAIKFKDKLHIITGFSAGAVIGVAFFDLIPEALSINEGFRTQDTVFLIIALGFSIYLILDRFFLFHSHEEGHCENEHHHSKSKRGFLSAGSLSLHSFFDGIAVGFAFTVSSAVGIVVAVAVLAHDFSDGINTVNFILKEGGSKKQALKWLFVDALAPVLGIIFTLFFSISESSLGLAIAIFAGFFLYIGASDLLPESHHSHSLGWTTAMTVVGMAVIFIVVRVAGV